MNTLEQAIVKMVREMPDEALLELLRHSLGQGDFQKAASKVAARRKKKEPRRTPRRTRPKSKRKVQAKTPAEISPEDQKALKAVQASRSPMTVREVADKLKIGLSTSRTTLSRLTKFGLLKRLGKTGRGSIKTYEAV